MEVIGWLSGVFLAICGLPTLFISIKRGNSNHIDWGLLSLWSLGEFLGLFYVISLKNYPLLLNYSFNSAILVVILWYKIKPRKENEKSTN